MHYPQFVTSANHASNAVIQLDSATCGRIILAHPAQVLDSGWFNPVGYYCEKWANIETDTYFSTWRLASPDILRTIPYMHYHYPEYLI